MTAQGYTYGYAREGGHHDWESDPDTLSACLKRWHGRPEWTRDRGASELCVPRKTYDGWCDGRIPDHEAMVRKLMRLIG